MEESLLAQQYLSDANEAELWMKEKEPIVGSNDYGKDEDSAQVRSKEYDIRSVRGHVVYGLGTVEEARGGDVRCDGIHYNGRNTKTSSWQV